ncbi:MAG: 2-oxo acid dehydrogenase subunit E2 [Candidatus Bathyarchaeia archaeon]
MAKALEEYKIVNSRIEGDNIILLDEINIGLAVATKDGLIVPVIRNANEKSLEEIASITKEIIRKAREDIPFKAEEFSGGTFTISNLGMFGVETFTPMINFPEAAILGVGKIAEKPVVIEKNIVVRPIVTLSLTFDHRIMDGAIASKFLQRVKELLETPRLALK